MNPAIKSHAAVVFGGTLKKLRRDRGYTARDLAEQVELEPSQYTEVELGIIRWFERTQEQLVAFALNLTQAEIKLLGRLLIAARKAAALTFSNIFTREMLRPARLRIDGKKATQEEEDQILDNVFAELV